MSGERRPGADFRPRPVQVRPKAAGKPSRDQFFTSRVQNGEFLLAATAVAPASPADAGESHRIIVPRSPPVAVDALGSPSADCVLVLPGNKLRKCPGTHRAQIRASRAPQGATGRGNPGPGAPYPAVSTLQVQTGHLNRLDGPAAARHSGRTRAAVESVANLPARGLARDKSGFGRLVVEIGAVGRGALGQAPDNAPNAAAAELCGLVRPAQPPRALSRRQVELRPLLHDKTSAAE